MKFKTNFPHHRLDVFRVAMEALEVATKLARKLPPKARKDGDQMLNAASSTVRNIAEGANRWGAGEKRSRFSIAQGEAAEAASVAEYLARQGYLDWPEALELIALEDRVCAMLTGLRRRWAS
jgi:four helix bundle protein